MSAPTTHIWQWTLVDAAVRRWLPPSGVLSTCGHKTRLVVQILALC